jgi:hypothetical protein
MYCASSGHECKITMARKQRPFYYASEEQFRWLQIIVSRLDPRVNTNDVAQLKELAESLIPDRTAKDERASNAEGGNEAGSGDGSGEQEEGMEGVVDGIGTLMLDPLGRESPPPLRISLIFRVHRGICICGISSKSQGIRPISTTRCKINRSPFPRTPRSDGPGRPCKCGRTHRPPYYPRSFYLTTHPSHIPASRPVLLPYLNLLLQHNPPLPSSPTTLGRPSHRPFLQTSPFHFLGLFPRLLYPIIGRDVRRLRSRSIRRRCRSRFRGR